MSMLLDFSRERRKNQQMEEEILNLSTEKNQARECLFF